MLRWLRRALINEWPLKLLSLVVAVSLWLYVQNLPGEGPIRRKTVETSVRPISTPQGLYVVQVTPEKVKVRVRGPQPELDELEPGEIRAAVDLSGSEIGRERLQVAVAGLPEGVDMLGVSPDTVVVRLERTASDKFPVKVIKTGEPADGYKMVGDPTVRPTQVAIVGSEAMIEKIAHVVVSVNINGLTEKGRVRKRVEVLDKDHRPISNLSIKPEMVEVELPITQVTTKRVPVRVRMGQPAEGYIVTDVRPSPNTVTLRGTPGVLEGITEVKTEYQSISTLTATRVYTLSLIIPRGTEPVGATRSVSVRVTVRPQAERQPQQPGPAEQPEDEGPEGEEPQEGPDTEPGEPQQDGEQPETPESTQEPGTETGQPRSPQTEAGTDTSRTGAADSTSRTRGTRPRGDSGRSQPGG